MQKHFYDLRYKLDTVEWRAKAKRDLVFQLWKQYQTYSQKPMLLDLGCGTGVLQTEFEKKFPNMLAYGIDVSKDAIKYAKMRGIKRAALFNGITFPFKTNTFDIVTAIDVLEHVPNDEKAIKEIYRVLKPGGIGIFLVPAHPHLWSTRDVRLQHYRRYLKNELEYKSYTNGFQIMTSKNADFGLYFVLDLMCKISKKNEYGVPDLKMEDASTNSVMNSVMYGYESIENFVQKFATFPVGISIVTVVRKP